MNNHPIFPRTTVGGVSLPRLLIGTNWFLGYSHTSMAKDRFIQEYQSRQRIANIISTFVEYGVDAVMGIPDTASSGFTPPVSISPQALPQAPTRG
jgi:hypothetical protein